MRHRASCDPYHHTCATKHTVLCQDARTPDDWADLFHTTHIHTHAGGPLIVPALVCIKVAVLCQESASVFERGRKPPIAHHRRPPTSKPLGSLAVLVTRGTHAARELVKRKRPRLVAGISRSCIFVVARRVVLRGRGSRNGERGP